jgi:hypothetical protein
MIPHNSFRPPADGRTGQGAPARADLPRFRPASPVTPVAWLRVNGRLLLTIDGRFFRVEITHPNGGEYVSRLVLREIARGASVLCCTDHGDYASCTCAAYVEHGWTCPHLETLTRLGILPEPPVFAPSTSVEPGEEVALD